MNTKVSGFQVYSQHRLFHPQLSYSRIKQEDANLNTEHLWTFSLTVYELPLSAHHQWRTTILSILSMLCSSRSNHSLLIEYVTIEPKSTRSLH